MSTTGVGQGSSKEDWIDISLPLRSGMVHWPGDPTVRIERVRDIGKGASHNLSEIAMGSHSGTHIDAPLHFLKKGAGIDAMPFTITNGRARVISIENSDIIDVAEIEPYHIEKGERVLFKTKNSSQDWKSGRFTENFVYLSEKAAVYLAKIRINVVGIDYLSIGGYHRNGAETHRTLLEAGIWIIEGLDLSAAAPGEYDLVCLPLKIENGEGAPARAALKGISNF